MLNEFELRRREEETISSGETTLLLQMEDDWQKLYYSEDSMPEFARFTYEQVVENPKPFLDAVGEIKAIPSYLYVFNYIFCKLRLALGRENQKRFISYLKKGDFPDKEDVEIEKKCRELLECDSAENESVLEGKDFDVLYGVLVRRLELRFKENGCKEQIDWPSFLRDLAEKFDYKKLELLALGLHMSLDDFEIFLCKVLKRSAINFYNRNEIFLYLVLKYADEFKANEYFRSYEALHTLYKDVKISPSNENRVGTVSTSYLQSNIQEIIDSSDETLFVKENEQLADYLGYIAVLNQQLESGEITRTAHKRFYTLWEDFKKRWQDTEEMQEMIAREREAKKKAVDQQTLLVTYKQDTGACIPAGTEFTAAECSGLAEVPPNVVLVAEREVHLPAITSEQVYVTVKPITKRTEQSAKVPEFVKEQELNIDSEKLKDSVYSVKVGSKVRFYQNEKKASEGTLVVDCVVGTYIPAGTTFRFQMDETEFVYESIEPANVQEKLVRVKPLQAWEQDLYANLKQKTRLKKHEELQVFKEPSENRMSGFVSAHVGKADHLGYFLDGQENHLLTLVCQKSCKIPKGMIFRYTYGNQTFLYETLDEVVMTPSAEATIEVTWTNKDDFQKIVNKKKVKEVECLPSGTYLDCKIKEVVSAFAPKRTVLSPEKGQESDTEYQVSNGALLRLIYQTSAKNAGEIGYYKGIPKYGEDYFLNAQTFKETRIIQSALSAMPANEERLRNYILTLKFLEFVWWYNEELGEEWNEEYGFEVEKMDYDMLLDDFEFEVDEEMMRCGFMPFYRTGFAYDAFLTLLLKSDDPLAIFQAVWSDQKLLIKEEN